MAAGATQNFDPKGRCFTGNVGFFIIPQCPVAGADFNHGKEGTNIGEFTLNVTKGDEAFDISCVNGINCWMNMSVTGSGWSDEVDNTSINSIENKALQQNQGNPGVYPVNCTDCIQLVGNPPCPSLPVGPPQTKRICNIQRAVQPGSNDTLTITLKEGKPFLTQKLCQFMVEEFETDNARTVEQVVRSRIIENWESFDEPEHLRTIRARILRLGQQAGYLLELYQMVVLDEEHSALEADDTLEQSELQLSGLVVRQHNKLRVYNLIYQEIFDDNWIKKQLKNLRPYSESFRFWMDSGGTDESRLLRGKALQEAFEWAKDKKLSYQDKQFLAASKEKEIQEEIASKEKKAQLERERKDREAAEQANRKARQIILNGTVILFLTLLVAAIVVILARKEVIEAQQKLKETYTYVAYPQQLKDLAGKFSSDSQTSRLISKKTTIKIRDVQIEQVYLHASKALAYQYL